MKFLRHLHHQPLLIWTLSLLFLLGLTVLGTTSSRDQGRPGVIRPLMQTGYTDARTLIEMLPGSNAALASDSFSAWLEEINAIATAAAKDHAEDGKAEQWATVLERIEYLEQLDPQDRAPLLGGISTLNSAVMSLVRSYR